MLTAIAFKPGLMDSIPHHDFYWREDPRGSPKVPGTVFRTVTYTLDNAGNRTNVNDNGTPIPYSPNNLNQYSQAGTYAVTNGADHQISSYQGLGYTYINDERLISVNGGFGMSYQLAYDALGRCVKRTLNTGGPSATTYYIYDGEKPIAEFSGSGNPLVAYNIYGKGIDEILERSYLTGGQWQTYCFQQDFEGSVTHLTDPVNGNMLELYRYDAFGAPSIWGPPEQNFPQLSASAYSNRFMFTGREFSPFGFYEYRARAYHPSLGRFMTEDPKVFDAGDYNLFRYCHNDPVDATDPMGLETDYAQTGAPTSGNHVATEKAAEDNSYNFIMALMQRQFSSAISAGIAGYQAYQAWGGLMNTTGGPVTGQGGNTAAIAQHSANAPSLNPAFLREGPKAVDDAGKYADQHGEPTGFMIYERDGTVFRQQANRVDYLGHGQYRESYPRDPSGATRIGNAHWHIRNSDNRYAGASFSRFDQSLGWGVRAVPVMHNSIQRGSYDIFFQGWRWQLNSQGVLNAASPYGY